MKGKKNKLKKTISNARAKNVPVKRSRPKPVKQVGENSILKEDGNHYSINSKIRAIGNSKGVILPNRVIEKAGIPPDAELVIQATEGLIIISEMKPGAGVNTDLSSWDAHFKQAIKRGKKPEKDTWAGLQNQFDQEEWT